MHGMHRRAQTLMTPSARSLLFLLACTSQGCISDASICGMVCL